MPSPPALPATTLLLVLIPGCAAPHSQPWATSQASREAACPPRLPGCGDETLTVVGYGGVPILQKALLWDGNGETDQAGVKARYLGFLSDRIALGAGLTGAVWFPSGHDILAGELEVVGRWYFHRSQGLGGFLEGAAGYVYSTDPVPPGGTVWNYTFSFGPGVDVPVARDLDFIGATVFHHISNAMGRENERNPSQNEAQFYLGLAWRF